MSKVGDNLNGIKNLFAFGFVVCAGIFAFINPMKSYACTAIALLLITIILKCEEKIMPSKEELEKAIKELNDYPFNTKVIMGEDGYNAIQLALSALEALPRLQAERDRLKIALEKIIELHKIKTENRDLLIESACDIAKQAIRRI